MTNGRYYDNAFSCCVCMAVAKAMGAIELLPPLRGSLTMYGGAVYCLEHLPHVEEAIGAVRRAKENVEGGS